MTDIYIYGAIGLGISDEDMSSDRFAYLLSKAEDDVCLHINSGGGDVFAANAMAELVRQYSRGKVTASIEGLAASAASYFALTADVVEIAPNALFMIHNPYGYCEGEAADMRKTADMLDVVKQTIVNQYVAKTGMSAEQIGAYMDAETWFSAEQAVKYGFADGYTASDMKIAACINKKMLDHFKFAPKDLVADENVKPEVEGDAPTTIANDDENVTELEASEVEVEATSCVECVNGFFLVK